MQNLSKVNSLKELRPNDIILLIDDNGKIGGWDKINVMNEDFSYDYTPLQNNRNQNYQGNLRTMQDRFFIYKVTNEMVEKYNDKKLDTYWLYFSQGYIFQEILFDEKKGAGSFISELLWKLIVKDFTLRVKFIDLCEENVGILRELSFIDTRGNISKNGINRLRNGILNIIR
jgi:hypothetical protein